MTTRYCPRCRAEVENAEGFCLLGHPLKFHAPNDSLAHLRAEVDRAFEQVEMEVAVAMGGGSESSTPPPPPAPPSSVSSSPRVFDSIDQPATGLDPLHEFAPAPRMDWGPEKPFFKRR